MKYVVKNILLGAFIGTCFVVINALFGWKWAIGIGLYIGLILAYEYMANDIVDRVAKKINGDTKQSTDYDNRDFKERALNYEKRLIPFDDALSNELMRIRSDLVNLKKKQQSNGFPEEMPRELVRMWMMYYPYNSNVLCKIYMPPGLSRNDGVIILVLDDSLEIDDPEQRFNSELLREINTFHTHKFKKGMVFTVYYWEPECLEYKEGWATIISIEDDTYDLGKILNVTLEIAESSRPFYEPSSETITVKISLSRGEARHFISDTESVAKKERDNLLKKIQKEYVTR